MDKLLIILLLFFSIISQVNAQSEYLDKSFGEDGVVALLTDTVSIGVSNLSTDEEGNIYVGYSNIYSENGSFCIYKIEQNGELDKNFGEQGVFCVSENDLSQETVWLWQENGFILEHHYSDESFIRIYDTDLNFLQEINLVATSPYSSGISISKNQKLLSHNTEEIHMFNSNGNLDNNFGTNGVLKVDDFPIDTFQFYFSKFINEEEIYISSISLANDYEYESIFAKLKIDGSFDPEFGIDGFVHKSEYWFTYNFLPHNNDRILMQNLVLDTTCLINYHYTTTAINQDGSTDYSFGDNGELPLYEDCENRWSINSINSTFTDDKIMNLSWIYYNDLDTSYFQDSALQLFTPNGKPVDNFGVSGELSLDFIPGIFVNSSTIDLKNNVYLASVENSGDTIFISKLAGNNFVQTPIGNNRDNGFTILNNPSNGDFVLDYQGDSYDDITIKLYDMLGRLIVAQKYNQINFGDQFEFDQYDLAPASYILKVSSKNEATLFGGKVLVIE